MNWLIYIGGGWLFISIIQGIIQRAGANKEKYWMIFLTSLSVWIWICWRFIA